MAIEQMTVLELLWNLITGKTEDVSKVQYFPQKPEFLSKEISQAFERSTPEAQGIDSQRIIDLLHNLNQGEHTHMHQIMILRNGKVITECGFAPYQTDIWHASYSLCKSITGIAIGMLIDEGKLHLNDKVLDIFKKQKNLMSFIRQRDITVEHLLTMSSGVSFNESGAISGNDWIKGFFDASLHFAPGSKFEYNSMNSYMLSAIVTELTEQTLMEYLTPRLWEPLGIEQVFWESCPQGINKGGWGLFLCPEDVAKIGQLFLQEGIWKGKRLISSHWMKMSTTKKIDVPEEMGFDGYGYQIWMGDRAGSFIFNGMLGQNVLVYPDLDMVIVTNAGNSVLFQHCQMLDFIHECFSKDYHPSDILPESKTMQKRLIQTIHSIEHPESIRFWKHGWKQWKHARMIKKKTVKLCTRLNNKTYQLNSGHVGIFPLALQVFHNNYTDGIHKIHFAMEENHVFNIYLYEGENVHKVRTGFLTYEKSMLNLHEEFYLISTSIQAAKDEDGRSVLKVEVAFLEDAAKRRFKIFFHDTLEQVEIRWDEAPGKQMIYDGLESIVTSAKSNSVFRNLKEKGIGDILMTLLDRTIQPTISGTLEKQQDETPD